MAQITITGHLFDSTGTAQVGAPVWFELTNLNGNVPYVSGTNVIVTTKVIVTTTAGGAYTAQIQGNDTITPANTFYKVTFNNNEVNYYSFTGAGPISLDSFTPLTTLPVPTGSVPTNILTGNNLFTGSNSFSGPVTFTGSFSFSGAVSVAGLLTATSGISVPTGQVIAWNSDTGLSRDAAGVIDVGNGTQGDKTGTLQFTNGKLVSAGVLSWNADTGFSRDAAGVIDVGNGSPADVSGSIKLGTISIGAATPTGAGGRLGLGNTAGFGNGAAGTAVTTTTKSTGSGPTTAQTVVNYLQIDIGGTKYWVPLMQ